MDVIIYYLKKYDNLVIPISIFIFTLFLYIHNLSRYVYGGDVGDLLLAIGVRGVAHPSGYPLFTLLGIVSSYLPIPQPLAYKVGLISAISSSFSVVFVYLICVQLTKNKIISAISSLTLAFSYVFWLYAEVAEAFALAGLFFLILSYLSLKYYEKKSNIYLYLLAFFTGLSFSHHLMILALIPSLAIIISGSNWKLMFDYKLIIKCLFLFLLGLLPYLYIPIAATHFPPYSWGNAININNFIQLVTRANYGWVPKSSKEVYISSLYMRYTAVLTYYVDLIHTITIFVIALSMLGIIRLIIKKSFTILISLFLAYFLIGPFYMFYGTNAQIAYYTMGIIERFYIFSLIFIVIFFALGCSAIVDLIEIILKLKLKISKRFNIYKFVLYLIFLIIPFYLLQINFKTTNLYNASIGENLGKDFLNSLPKNSFLFISGDTPYLNTMYVNHVLGFRTDITVINPQVPGLDMKYVKKIYPKFKNGIIDFAVLKSKINQEVLKNYGKRLTFSGYGATSVEEKGIEWIPYGLSQKMIFGSFDQEEANFINQTNQIWKKMNYKKYSELSDAEKASQTLLTVQRLYSQAAFNTGVFMLKKYGNLEESKKYFDLTIEISPSENLGRWGLANYYFDKKDCNKSEKIMKVILNEDKEVKAPYVYLYLIYDKCFNDQIKAKQIEKNYEFIFKEKLPKNR